MCFFGNHCLYENTSSFKMKGDVTTDHFLMLQFQEDSVDTVGFSTYDFFLGGVGIVDLGGPK